MKLKICGLKNIENIIEISNEIRPDFLGFIFYKNSPRFVQNLDIKELNKININKVGVFVNENIYNILKISEVYNLKYAQIHGEIELKFLEELKKNNIKILKAINISNKENFNEIKKYQDFVDFFLFDSKSEKHGGSGIKFNWELLNEYKEKTLFFLSGGISINDVNQINKIKHPSLFGLDLNSKFEINAGTKDIKLLKEFKQKINL